MGLLVTAGQTRSNEKIFWLVLEDASPKTNNLLDPLLDFIQRGMVDKRKRIGENQIMELGNPSRAATDLLEGSMSLRLNLCYPTSETFQWIQNPLDKSLTLKLTLQLLSSSISYKFEAF